MVTQTPETRLSTGQRMPMVGLGTWRADQQSSDCLQLDAAVELALQEGVRLIDTAYVNGNEMDVGRGLMNSINKGVVRREEVFLVSKLWNTFHRCSMVEKACRESLKALQVDCLDLYLMHWPIAMQPNQGLWPKQGNQVMMDQECSDFMETWKAMEKLVEKNLVKAIGLSNVNKQQLQRCLREGSVKPAVVQMEVHPFCYDRDLLDFCKKESVVVMAYSPLGGHELNERFMQNEVIQQIAKKERLTPAQVLLLWDLSEGRVCIPKSINQQRIKENFQFLTKMQKLPMDEVKQISQLSQGKTVRTCDPQEIFNVQIFYNKSIHVHLIFIFSIV